MTLVANTVHKMYLFVKHAPRSELCSSDWRYQEESQTSCQSNHSQTNDKSFYSLQFFNSMWFKQIIILSIKFLSTVDHVSNIIVGIWLFTSKTNHNIIGLRWGYSVAVIIAALIQLLHLVWNFQLNNQIHDKLTKILIKIAMTFVGLVGYICFLIPWPYFVYCNRFDRSHLKSTFYSHLCSHQTIYPLICDLVDSLHVFFVRVLVETIPFSCVMVSILTSGYRCSNDFNSTYHDDYIRYGIHGFSCNYVNITSTIYLSLCLKIISLLITLFVLRIVHSTQISFHTQLRDGLICIGEITRFLCSLMIVFLVYMLQLDKYYILLQLYFIPTVVCVLIITFYQVMHDCKFAVVCFSPILFSWNCVIFFLAFNVLTIAFCNDQHLLEDKTWHIMHCIMTAMSSPTYYSLLNKISHYFANYQNINTLDINQNIRLNQQIGCINYQIIDFLNQYFISNQEKKIPFPDSIKSKGPKIKAYLVEAAKKLEHSLQTEKLNNSIQLLQQQLLQESKSDIGVDKYPLTNSMHIFFFNIINVIADHEYIRDFRDRYHYNGEFAVVAISFLISRIIMIILPFYWWFFIDYKGLEKQLQYFVNFCLYLLTFLYIAIGYVLIRYQFPLFYKMKHVLPVPTERKFKWRYRHILNLLIRYSFRNCDRDELAVVHVQNKIDEELFNASIRQFNGIQIRPMVHQVICMFFGKDLGQIVFQYVPIWDQTNQTSIYHTFFTSDIDDIQVKIE